MLSLFAAFRLSLILRYVSLVEFKLEHPCRCIQSPRMSPYVILMTLVSWVFRSRHTQRAWAIFSYGLKSICTYTSELRIGTSVPLHVITTQPYLGDLEACWPHSRSRPGELGRATVALESHTRINTFSREANRTIGPVSHHRRRNSPDIRSPGLSAWTHLDRT